MWINRIRFRMDFFGGRWGRFVANFNWAASDCLEDSSAFSNFRFVVSCSKCDLHVNFLYFMPLTFKRLDTFDVLCYSTFLWVTVLFVLYRLLFFPGLYAFCIWFWSTYHVWNRNLNQGKASNSLCCFFIVCMASAFTFVLF